jgi:enoyl-CoA hydratase
VKLGIIPGYGGTQRLARLVGKGRALQLTLTGETIDAQEALRIGLVNAVVPSTELMAAARKMMGTMLANGPVALGLAIETIDKGLDLPLEEAIALEAENFARCARTEDMREGASAFLAKRAPNFTGK